MKNQLLARGVLGEKKGLTDSIDETSWTPKKQTKGLTVLDVLITKYDTYNSRCKKNQFDTFLKGTQNAVHSDDLEDLLMRLFSQFIKPSQLSDIIDYIDGAEYVVKGSLDKQLKDLRGNLEKYYSFISKYHAELVTENAKKNN